MQKQALFILDDLGLEPFDAPSRLSLLEILEDRLGRRSSIIVSQVPISNWHDVIGDPTIADAICDRIVHSAHRIELKGESVRKIYSQKQQEARLENEPSLSQEGGTAQQRPIEQTRGGRLCYHCDTMPRGGPPRRFLNQGGISRYPLERAVIPGTTSCAVGYAQSHLRGFLMIRKELMCITRAGAAQK